MFKGRLTILDYVSNSMPAENISHLPLIYISDNITDVASQDLPPIQNSKWRKYWIPPARTGLVVRVPE